jgi:glycosyltransferase involved in cell wall biosynthesis
VAAGQPYLVRLRRLFGRRRTQPEPGHPIPEQTAASAGPGPAGPLRELVRAAFSIPEQQNHIIGPFTRAGIAAARDGVDLIYSSAPPFSVHLSARRLARRLRVPWVAELRDPWRHPGTERPAALHPLTRWVDRRLERGVLTGADAVVMVTEAARDHVLSNVPGTRSDRLLVAWNGVPEWPIASDPPVRTGPFRIVHAGSLYLGRDPRGFLEGLSLLVHERGLAPGRLVVELIGNSRDYGGASLVQVVHELGLAPFVEFDGWLPHAEARRRLLAADALLLFAQRQPLQVPNKLFEYLATGRPILAFVDRGGESARMLRDLPVGRLLDEADPAAVAREVGRLLDEGRSEPRYRCPEALLARSQMQTLVAELTRRFARPGSTLTAHR